MQKVGDISDMLNFALAKHREGDFIAARGLYIKILNLKPSNPDVIHLLGVTYFNSGDLQNAAVLITKAIELNPNNFSYYNNMGNVMAALKDFNNATVFFKKALKLKPDYKEARNNLGSILGHLQLYQDEIELYKKGLEFDNYDYDYLGGLIKAMQNSCMWENLEQYIQDLTKLAQLGNYAAISPYHSLSLNLPLAITQKIAASYAAKFQSNRAEQNGGKIGRISKEVGDKIRIGYVSADFRDHPTAHLINGLFKHHDRDKFEIYAFSYGANDNSEFRKKIAENVDHFIEIGDLNDHGAHLLVKQHKIDILIDVMGYIQNARPGIFALRPAPVQISYLAYPGTMGAKFIDYLVTDREVIKPEEEQYFTEKPLYLKHTYFPIDVDQKIEEVPSRAELGIAESSFVFCCFNKTNKIDRQVFLSWCNILKQVPDSILWLLVDDEFTRNNLKQEAKNNGLEPERLIFAARLEKAKHLARLSQADLFLDCFLVSAHTTAIDAIYAKVPLITKYGDNIMQRAAASVLKAAGLAELVVLSFADYEKLAIYYATNKEAYVALKQKIINHSKESALFDMQEYARDFEEMLTSLLTS